MHGRIRHRLGSCLLAWLGCGDAAPIGVAAQAGAVPLPADCDDAAARAMEEEMMALCRVGATVPSVAVPRAPWPTEPAAPPAEALRIEVDARGISVDHARPAAVGNTVAALETAEKRRSGGDEPWVLAIDGTVTRQDVATVMSALADTGRTRGHLLLGTKAVDVPAPRDPKLLAEYAALAQQAEPSERAAALARAIERHMPVCTALTKINSHVSMDPHEDRCAYLAHRIPAAIVECGCAGRDDLLTGFYALSMGGATPPKQLSAAAPVMLDPTASPAAGNTWAEIVAGLDEPRFAALWVTPAP